eukprot:jgi/Galph1/625/GphlegSOOS_G5350.1
MQPDDALRKPTSDSRFIPLSRAPYNVFLNPTSGLCQKSWTNYFDLPVQYTVEIYKGILDVTNDTLATRFLPDMEQRRRFLVVDEQVYKLYGEEILNYFKSHQVKPYVVVIPGGEENKTYVAVDKVLEELCEYGLHRREPIVAIGGGVVLDIVGFAASCYRRGVPYIRVPTTLLAIVDASVGVKTGVDYVSKTYGRLKNRMGAFYAPCAAFLDKKFIATQDDRNIINGLGEIMKLALVCSPELFDLLEKHGRRLIEERFQGDVDVADRVIQLSVQLMLEEIGPNLWEYKLERSTDFGHTFSKIIEMEAEPPLLHGEAVNIDGFFCVILAHRRKLISTRERDRVFNTMKALNLPTIDPLCVPKVLWRGLEDAIEHRHGKQRLPLLNVTRNESCIVSSPNVSYTDTHVKAKLQLKKNVVEFSQNEQLKVIPKELHYEFCTKLKPAKLGLLQVGWGGNNGSTVTAGIIANREGICWETRSGIEKPNLFGSLSQHGTLRLGLTEDGTEVFVPLKKLLPLVEPKDLVLGGWDISACNLAEAVERAHILEPDLKKKLRPYLQPMVPLPGILDLEFIAKNQLPRANNVIEAKGKAQQVEIIRQDIQKFKKEHQLDFVVVVWTANSERYSVEIPGVNDTAENLLKSVSCNHKEVSPSTLYAIASILEGCPYINGSPQNTFVPGCIQLAEERQVFIAGDDFKSGQTKMKSVLVDYFIGSGMKVESMVTYNHLGNNDMFQLTDGEMWKPKSAAKSRVIEDIVCSNGTLYEPRESPDHVVVVKYVSSYGDSKSDVSEYVTKTFLNCPYRTVMYNNCLDSALCAPLIIDLAIFTELFHRVSYRTGDMKEFVSMHPILSSLSFYMKIPRTPSKEPHINALHRQRSCIENMFRALVGLTGEENLLLDTKCPQK